LEEYSKQFFIEIIEACHSNLIPNGLPTKEETELEEELEAEGVVRL
jgi:hypothetical protein